MNHNVISRNYLPRSIPVFPTITIWLLLDKLQPSSVVLGIVWTLWAIVFISLTVHSLFLDEAKEPVLKP